MRQAINRAIDRQELLDRAMHGYGAPAFGFYTPAVAWAYNGDAHVPPFDRGRAARLLAAAGCGRMPRVRSCTSSSSRRDLTPYSRSPASGEQLRPVGIAVRPVLLRRPLLERSLRATISISR